jgi:hypothetical protein
MEMETGRIPTNLPDRFAARTRWSDLYVFTIHDNGNATFGERVGALSLSFGV